MPLHPQAARIVKAFEERMGTARGVPTIEERRAAVVEASSESWPRMARVKNAIVPGPVAGGIPVRIFTPSSLNGLPILMYFHGGGWVIGSIDSTEGLARYMAAATGCIVISVGYRLAPEHKFPKGLEDCYAATKWAAAQAESFGGDGSRIAVCGDSSGGNLAAAVCLVARDRGGPKIVYQALIYPVLDRNFSTSSYEDNSKGYLLTRRMMVGNWRDYLADEESAINPYAAPLQSRDLSGLPAAYVITVEYDPLRDEGASYANMLRAAGVPVTYVCYAGMVHGFFGYIAQVDLANEAMASLSKEIQLAVSR